MIDSNKGPIFFLNENYKYTFEGINDYLQNYIGLIFLCINAQA